MNSAKPQKVLIMDAYCASHVGNDVLLENSIHIIGQAFPGSIIVIHAKTANAFENSLGIECKRRLFPDPQSGFMNKTAWVFTELLFMITQTINIYTFKISPYKLAFWHKKNALYDFTNSEACISISGELINDSFRKVLPFYLFMYWLAWKLGNKVIIFPQSIGPLNRKWTRTLTKYVLEKCIIVSARNKVSHEELTSLGLNHPNIIQSPDVWISQPMIKKDFTKTFLRQIGAHRNTAKLWTGVTVSSWTEEGIKSGNYISALVDALVTTAKNHDLGILIMPANMPVNGNNSSDYNASVKLFYKLRNICNTVILKPEIMLARLFKSITGELDVFISTRMHESILSTMAGTPTITINTQRKLLGYMELIGQKHYSLDTNKLTSSRIHSAISDVLLRSRTIRAELSNAKNERNNELDNYIINLCTTWDNMFPTRSDHMQYAKEYLDS